MNPADAAHEAWGLLLDCAPKHVCKEFRGRLRSNWPDVASCYVDGGHTGACQPLDRSVTKPFKESLRKIAARDLANMVIDDLEDLQAVMNKPFLKNKVLQWVKAAVEEIQTKEGMFEHAWSL